MQSNTVEVSLKSEQVQVWVLKILLKILKFVPWDINLTQTKLTMILHILILAAASRSSIHATCAKHQGCCTGVTVRNSLKLIFCDIVTTEKILNHLLKHSVKRRLVRNSPIICTDLVELEYYGQPHNHSEEIRHGPHKKGTNRFHAYATLYLNVKGQRYTLAITYVLAHDTMKEVLSRLNRHLIFYSLKPSLWLLDRGYYAYNVIQWFKQRKKPFIMPMILRGKPLNHPNGPSGTYLYKTWTKSGWSEYGLVRHNTHGPAVMVDVAIVVTYKKGPGQYHDPDVLIYACFGVRHLRLRQIKLLYQRRFAIETSYRQLREAKAKTASRHPGLRYAMVGISLVLRNIWIFLHFHILYDTQPGPGGRKICLPKLIFATMLDWLRYAIEFIYPLILETKVQQVSRLQILKI